jgi:uncharacterized protein (DUF302 family)
VVAHEQITESDFNVQLITMRSKKSFAEVTAEIESLFQPFDLEKLSNLAAKADPQEFVSYAKQVDGTAGFGMFFQLDMGALMRPGGIQHESKLYLIGSVVTGQGFFKYSGVAGLVAPVRFCVSKRDGEDTRIDIDRPSSIDSQFPELSASTVPAIKDAGMLPLLAKVAGVSWPEG